MKTSAMILIVLAAAAGSASAQVQQASLTAAADTWVRSSAPTTPSAEGPLRVGYSTTNFNERALISFALPTLPPGAIVTQAQLQCTVTAASSGSTLNVACSMAANGWSEASTWNGSPNYYTNFTWAAPGSSGLVVWDATPMVQAWYQLGYPNFGFALISDAENSGVQNDRTIAHRLSATPPVLLLTYLLPSISYGTPEWEYVAGMNNGPTEGSVNVVFLGDGFSGAAELQLFKNITDALVPALFDQEPYKSLASRFNVTRVNCLSTNSGVRLSSVDPWSTAFDTFRYDVGGSNILLVPNERWDTTVTQAVSKVPAADIILIISNTTSSLDRGAAFLPPFVMTGSRQYRGATCYAGSNADRVAVHEFGHAIGSLGDEYDNNQTIDTFPNLSLDGSSTTVKWKKWVGQGDVQAPVAFGANGLHKPVGDNRCIMNNHLTPDFCLVCTEHLGAKILRYASMPASEDFSLGASAAAVAPGDPTVIWGVDATPAAAPGGAVRSGPASLNLNNGTNYDAGSRIRASATLPLLPAGGAFHFWCNRDTENADGKDRRFVQFVQSDSSEMLQEVSSTELGMADCGPAGVWHEHTIPVGSWWGAVQPRFFFDSVDAGANGTTGWFIDDISMVARPRSSGGGGGGGGCGLTGLEGTALIAILAALRRRRPV